MPIRKAEAEWKGNLIEGVGRLKVGSGPSTGRTRLGLGLKKDNRRPIQKS